MAENKKKQFIFATVKEVDENGEPKAVNEKGELEAVASTPTLDRDNEIIEAAAWKRSLETYLTNPVILAAHLHRLPSGNSPVIGSALTIDATDDALIFRMHFAGTDLGREYEQLYREKHMRAFSVGFIPLNGEWRDDNQSGKKKRIYVYTEMELLEISAVPVPANPEALARMRAAMAPPIDELKTAMFEELGRQLDERGNLVSKQATEEICRHVDDAVAQIADKVHELTEQIELSSDGFGQLPQVAPAADDKASERDDGETGAASSSAAADLADALREMEPTE